jgi:hypothetical protein
MGATLELLATAESKPISAVIRMQHAQTKERRKRVTTANLEDEPRRAAMDLQRFG